MKGVEVSICGIIILGLFSLNEGLKCYTCDECTQENVLHHFLVDYKGDAAYCVKYNKTVLRGGKEIHLMYRRPVFNATVAGLDLNGKCVAVGPGVELTPVALATSACYCQSDGCNSGPAQGNSAHFVTKKNYYWISLVSFLLLMLAFQS